MSDYKPTNDPANDGSLPGSLSAFMRSVLMGVEDMLPATVVSYDDATNRAVLRPLIMMGTTNGQKISRAEVPNIPVFRFGGGGFFIRFPIKAGDFGWLKANDRDISLMMQRGGMEDWPNTERLHSFSDAMFFPDTLKGWLIDGANADAMVVQSMDGSVCISLHDDKLTTVSPRVEITAPETAWEGDIDLNGNLTVTGDVSVTGNISAEGNVEVTGVLTVPTINTTNLTASGGATVGGINFASHSHHYTWTDPGGEGDTGGAQ